MARQGKIARLPQSVREELNRRLLDGEPASKILPWLNDLEETKKVLEGDFEGLRVNDNNLSDWRQGGYEDWLKRRERLESTRELAGYAVKLAKAAGGNLTEGAAAILSGQIMEVLEDVGASDKTPVEKMASVLALTKSLSALRKGDQNQQVLEQNERRLEQNERRIEQMEEQLRLQRETFLLKTLDAATLSKVSAIAQDATLDNAQKIAALRKVYFADVDAMDQAGEVKLPD